MRSSVVRCSLDGALVWRCGPCGRAHDEMGRPWPWSLASQQEETLVANGSVSTEAVPIPNDRERSSHGRRCGPTAAPLGSWGPATVPGRSRPVISSALRAPQGGTGQSRRRELGELTRETDGGSRNGIRIHLRVLVDNWIGCKEQLATSSRSTASRGRLIATRGHPQPRPGGCSARREAGVVAGGRPDGQTPASAVPRTTQVSPGSSPVARRRTAANFEGFGRKSCPP
jgi:hypothetical protein